ncbi:BamA/TamA family outer membrane protein [Cucumibacter marinus]|uniref:hypothetical protein n=1 Tax=Cucumibacter marinus TaxID=1121252 RepID=UPI0003FE77F1|nr:hypothetical protein [Cucumibacter marinus]
MKPAPHLLAAFALALALLPAPFAHAQEAAPEESAIVPPDFRAILDQSTNLPEVLSDAGIRRALRAGERPAEVALEEARLNDLLIAVGYLDADLSIEAPVMEPAGNGALRVNISPGPFYVIGPVEISVEGAADSALTDRLEDAALFAEGQPANADILAEARDRIEWQAAESGFSFAEIVSATYLPDPANATAQLSITIAPGIAAVFRQTDVSDVPADLKDAALALTPYSPGEPFTRSAFDTMRAALNDLPHVHRSDLEIRPAPGGTFDLVVSARHDPPAIFDDPIARTGVGVFAAALLVIALGMITGFRRDRRPLTHLIMFRVPAGLLAFASIGVVILRAATLG